MELEQIKKTRSAKTSKKYLKFIKNDKSKCGLCRFRYIIKKYKHWVLMRNEFPYDKYFSKSHMLVLKRHKSEDKLSLDELVEYKEIKKQLSSKTYDYFLENLKDHQSIPDHYHVHLVKWKK